MGKSARGFVKITRTPDQVCMWMAEKGEARKERQAVEKKVRETRIGEVKGGFVP